MDFENIDPETNLPMATPYLHFKSNGKIAISSIEIRFN